MSLSLRKLLENPSLDLRLVVDPGEESAAEAALDHEFEWLHATDLIDPTPFLGPAEVILTLGWQFPLTDPVKPSMSEVRVPADKLERIYDDYAALVAAHGVIGIGFGSDVVHRGVPRPLVKACSKHGLILFDVPYEISFMDLLQEAARLVQRDQSERQTRSLRAQKAIAHAATRRDGLNATLRETARQLGCGVSLFDSLGHAVITVEAPRGPRVGEGDIAPVVRKALHEQLRFCTAQVSDEVEAIVQMLGESTDPTGVLVLTLSEGFDDVSRNVLSSVLALVSVSLEQNQALASLHTTLRQALLQLLLSGNIGMTRHILESVWGPLPVPPMVAMVGISRQYEVTRILPRLESMSADDEVPVFYAQYQNDLAILVQADSVEHVIAQLEPFDLVIGRSRCDRWDGLELALEEAKKAAEFGIRTGRTGSIPFSGIWQDGVADLIDATDATHVARRVLAPLERFDRTGNSELITTLRVWLENHGRLQTAARALGVHRHTLMSRLEKIAQLTGSDLDDFQVRADLVLALRYHRPESSDRSDGTNPRL
ncbi:purine catabolism regulator [Brevibacterium sanguinis]|uniref:Purine catabolism regulator n=2 Tax=Brevibacterium TaxID=1696 RepID=A0A366IE84_9MICO|nr:MULTISPECIES: PucR family transcriptional regulator [Brevibacterium]RBP62957.1 purine catabolism regulator [Brevibacterium sanguinis]RBP69498.1 purine catabolism regulator [Brevibacterium celere]